MDAEQEGIQLSHRRTELQSRLNELTTDLQGKSASERRYQSLLGMTPKQALEASAVGMNPTLSALKAELYTLKQKLALLSTTLTDQNPKVEELRAKVQQVESDIRKELRQTLGRNVRLKDTTAISDSTREDLVRQLVKAHSDVNRLGQEVGAIRTRLVDLNTKISKYPELEEHLNNLKQTESTYSNSLDALRRQLMEARLREAQTLSNVFVVNQAPLPKSANFPAPKHVMVIGLLAGLGAALLAGIIAERLDRKQALWTLLPWQKSEMPEPALHADASLARFDTSFTRLEAIQDRVLEREASLADERMEILDQQKALNDRKGEHETSAQQLTDQAGTLEALKSSLETDRKALDARKETLDRRQQAIQTREEKISNEMLAWEGKHNALQAERNSLHTRIGSHTEREQNVSAHSILLNQKQAELDALTGRLTEQQTELDTQYVQIQQEQQKLDDRQTVFKTKQTELDTLTHDLLNTQSELDVRETQLQTQQHELDARQTELQAHETRLGDETRMLDELRDDLNTQEQTLAQAQQAMDKQLATEQADLRRYRDRLNAQETTLHHRELSLMHQRSAGNGNSKSTENRGATASVPDSKPKSKLEQLLLSRYQHRKPQLNKTPATHRPTQS